MEKYKKKFDEEILKESDTYHYQIKELESILTNDEYGYKFQFTSSKGRTHWMNFDNRYSIEALKSFVQLDNYKKGK